MPTKTLSVNGAGFEFGQWVLFMDAPNGDQWVVPTDKGTVQALVNEGFVELSENAQSILATY